MLPPENLHRHSATCRSNIMRHTINRVIHLSSASLSSQLIGIATIFGWVFAASFVTWMVLKVVMGLRVSEEEEYEGVDLAECGLEAYPEFTGSKGSGI